jgi:hypothetical protein
VARLPRTIERLWRAPAWATRLGVLVGGLLVAMAAVVALVLLEPPAPLQVEGWARAGALAAWIGLPIGILAGVVAVVAGLVGLARLDGGRARALDDPGRASGRELGLGWLGLGGAALAAAVALAWVALSAERPDPRDTTTFFAMVAALGTLGIGASIAGVAVWRRGPARAPIDAPRGRPPWLHVGVLAVLTAVGALLQLTLLGWFIEDAAISFAYARNAAMGEGFVTFVGGERVEGYSNPLWTFLLTAFYLVGVDGFVSSKVLGLVAGAACVPLTWAIAREVRPAVGDPVPLLAAALIASHTQHVVWSASGLENSLLNALMAAAMWRALVEGRRGGAPWSALLWLGVAVSRPEGILYAAVGGAFSLVARGALAAERGGGPAAVVRATLLPTLAWLALFFVPFGLYHAWRYNYFAFAFPNTYYAKKGNPSKAFQPWAWGGKGWRYVRDWAESYAHAWLMPVYVVAATGLRGWRIALAVGAVVALGLALLPPMPPEWRDTWLGPVYVPRWWDDVRVVVVVGFGALLVLAPIGRRGGRALALSAALSGVAIFFAIYAGGDWMAAFRWMASLAVPQAVFLAAGVGTLADAAARAVDARSRVVGLGAFGVVGLVVLAVGIGLVVPPVGELGGWLDLRPVDAATTLGAGLVLLVGAALAALRGGRGWGPAGWGLAIALVGAVVLPAAHHLDRFIQKPTTSPFTVKKRADYVRSVADDLHLTERPVILDVDMGAIMYWSGGELSDIAGLVDVSMAHHWFEPAFLDEYLHGERNPHFAHVHGGWARTSGIDRRPWWKPGYVELPAYRSGKKRTHGGNHLRRDLVVAADWPARDGLPADFGGGISLVGLAAPAGQVAPGGALFVEIAWRLDAPLAGPPPQPIVWIGDERGVAQSWELPWGYGWFPPEKWGVGEVVYTRHALRVPEAAPLGPLDLGVALIGPDGAFTPTGHAAPALGPEAGAPVFVAGELRWTDRITVAPADEVRAAALADLDAVRQLADADQCDEAEDRWVLAQRRVVGRTFREANLPVVAPPLAACRARSAERLTDRAAQVDALVRAHRWVPHSAEARRVRAPLVAAWWDEGLAARAADDHEAAFRAFSAVVAVDPSRSWARRYAEEARDCRLGIDKSGRCPPPEGAAMPGTPSTKLRGPRAIGVLPGAPLGEAPPDPGAPGDEDGDEAGP